MDELAIFAAVIGSGVTAAVVSAWGAWRARQYSAREAARVKKVILDSKAIRPDYAGSIVVNSAEAQEIMTRVQRVSDDVDNLKVLLADDFREKKVS